MVRFEFEFDKSDRKYFPGDKIKCTVKFSTKSSVKCRCIWIQFYGFTEVMFVEHYTTGSGSNQTRHRRVYRGEEEYFNFRQTVEGVQGGPTMTIPPGNYTHSVSYVLPKILPQSFEGTYGHIRYLVNVKMVVPWGFDCKDKAPFYINPRLDLNDFPLLRQPIQKEATKTFGCCCCESQPLTLVNILPKQGFVPGDRVKFLLRVDNRSDIKIDYASVELTEQIVFYAKRPWSKNRVVDRKILRYGLYDGYSRAIAPLEERTLSSDVFLDPKYDFKMFQGCNIIVVDYFIESKAHVSGCHKNLKNHSKIKIGTEALRPFGEVIKQQPLSK